MRVFTLSQLIQRPVTVVFDAVTRLDEYPSWHPKVRSARRLSQGNIGNESLFELVVTGQPPVRYHLVDFRRDREVRIVWSLPIFAASHRMVFTPKGATDNATEIEHSLERHPKGLFKLMDWLSPPAGDAELAQYALALKEHLETRA